MHKRRILLLCCLAFLLAGCIGGIIHGNTALEVTEYTVTSADLPEAFTGFRIVQISDLHNTEFGNDNEKLLTRIRAAEPDLIAITGDLVDSRRTDMDVALAFASQAVQIAPCCYVPGNHESRIAEYDVLKTGLEALGITVLEDRFVTLTHNGTSITVYGVLDPSFKVAEYEDRDKQIMEQTLELFPFEEEAFTVLLAHKPEMFDVYCDNAIDLVLSGHVHGGQFRLPGVGGLFAPSQGLFPEYDGGIYQSGSCTMVISRGLGNSAFPVRINNRPEIVTVILQSA